MKVERALLSVNDKFGIESFGAELVNLGVELIASGGTGARLTKAGVPYIPVAEVTGYADDFIGGRVKTLQAKVHAGILADRDDPRHMQELRARGIRTIDLVCVNLYQFGDTDQDAGSSRRAIGYIDIGGPMMIRTAALNHSHVAPVVRIDSYLEIVDLLRRNNRSLPEKFLQRLAVEAFQHIAAYEAKASAWFTQRFPLDRRQ